MLKKLNKAVPLKNIFNISTFIIFVASVFTSSLIYRFITGEWVSIQLFLYSFFGSLLTVYVIVFIVWFLVSAYLVNKGGK